MDNLLHILPIVALTVLAIITSIVLEKKEAKRPEIYWVLLAWTINFSVYYVLTESMEKSFVVAGIAFIVTSVFTYRKLIDINFLYSGLLTITSTLALVSLLVYFDKIPMLSGQDAVVEAGTYASNACQCENEECIQDVYLSIDPRFFESNSWEDEEKKLKKCVANLSKKVKFVAIKKLLQKSISVDKSDKEESTPSMSIAEDDVDAAIRAAIERAGEHSDIQEILNNSIANTLMMQSVIEQEEAAEEIKTKGKVNVVSISSFKNLSSIVGKRVRISQIKKKPIIAEFIRDKSKEIKVKVFVFGGYYVFPIRKKNLEKIEVGPKYKFGKG